jgi:hypothetical protein
MYTDSIHIHLNNPAAYGKLGLTTYTAGLSHREIWLNSFTETQNTSVTNLDYLSIGFPLAKNWGMGFGITPYSDVGYNLLDERESSNQGTILNEYSGQGGINKVYLSLGHQLARNLYIGATVNLNFGNLSNQRIQSVEDVEFGTLDRRQQRVSAYPGEPGFREHTADRVFFARFRRRNRSDRRRPCRQWDGTHRN